MKLSQEAYKLIDKELVKYPADQKISAVMAGLRIAQTELGWLPTEAIEEVANYLEIEPIAAF
ncbi:MAG: NAD(P)H-dependent oxidoreductase subunit E, partial [Limnobacter sp.]|nr:NAD(P)H-dependent oxidoreductase subunit E [Limnobacter sp.]